MPPSRHRTVIVGLTLAVFLTGFMGSGVGGVRLQGSLPEAVRALTQNILNALSDVTDSPSANNAGRETLSTVEPQISVLRTLNQYKGWKRVEMPPPTTPPPPSIPQGEQCQPKYRLEERALEEGSGPSFVATDKAGNVWFTETLAGKIGRIDPRGELEEFPTPTENSYPNGIAVGPDGNVWFAETGVQKIGRITPGGDITEFPLPESSCSLWGIAGGSDNRLWATCGEFGELPNAVISIPTNMDPQKIKYHRLGEPGDQLSIVLGPDKRMWFTDTESSAIGAIDVEGKITRYPLTGHRGIRPVQIANGAYGRLWFTSGGPAGTRRLNGVMSMTTQGVVHDSHEFSPFSAHLDPEEPSYPYGLAYGKDTRLWVAENEGNRIVSISQMRDPKTGKQLIEEFDLPTPGSSPMGVAVDSQGTVWFAQHMANKIGRLVRVPCDATPPPPPSPPPPRPPEGGSCGVGPDNIANIEEFAVPDSIGHPSALVAAPDGNVWFVASAANKIGKISPDGQMEAFPLPKANSWPTGIAAGSDGMLWFIERRGKAVGMATNGGSVVKELPLPKNALAPWSIVAGPGGLLWFDSRTIDANGAPHAVVGSVNPRGGGMRLFPFPRHNAPPVRDLLAEAGNLWVVVGSMVAHVDPAGTMETFSVPRTPGSSTDAHLRSIVLGPDGALWMGEDENAIVGGETTRIRRMTKRGEFSAFPLPDGFPPNDIVFAPDGNLWIAGHGLASMTLDGKVSKIRLPGVFLEGRSITVGPDGNLWIAMGRYGEQSKIVKITLRRCGAVTPPPDRATLCGNGIVDKEFEQCDDGNNVDHDECDNACTIPLTYKRTESRFPPGNECTMGGDDKVSSYQTMPPVVSFDGRYVGYTMIDARQYTHVALVPSKGYLYDGLTDETTPMEYGILAMSSDARFFVLLRKSEVEVAGAEVVVFDRTTGESERLPYSPPSSHIYLPWRANISDDGNIVAYIQPSASGGGGVILWDRKKKITKALPKLRPGDSLSLTADGRFLYHTFKVPSLPGKVETSVIIHDWTEGKEISQKEFEKVFDRTGGFRPWTLVTGDDFLSSHDGKITIYCGKVAGKNSTPLPKSSRYADMTMRVSKSWQHHDFVCTDADVSGYIANLTASFRSLDSTGRSINRSASAIYRGRSGGFALSGNGRFLAFTLTSLGTVAQQESYGNVGDPELLATSHTNVYLRDIAKKKTYIVAPDAENCTFVPPALFKDPVEWMYEEANKITWDEP